MRCLPFLIILLAAASSSPTTQFGHCNGNDCVVPPQSFLGYCGGNITCTSMFSAHHSPFNQFTLVKTQEPYFERKTWNTVQEFETNFHAQPTPQVEPFGIYPMWLLDGGVNRDICAEDMCWFQFHLNSTSVEITDFFWDAEYVYEPEAKRLFLWAAFYWWYPLTDASARYSLNFKICLMSDFTSQNFCQVLNPKTQVTFSERLWNWVRSGKNTEKISPNLSPIEKLQQLPTPQHLSSGSDPTIFKRRFVG